MVTDPRITVFAIMAMLAAPAVACTVDLNYRTPSNLQLVENADVILIGRIEPSPAGERSLRETALHVTPLVALKGDLPAVPLRLDGSYTSSEYHYAFPSNPYDLAEPHPEAMMGGCSRHAFQANREAVFFLREGDEGLGPYSMPFSRWAEDVPSHDAPWVRAVRIYVEATAMNGDEQRNFLSSERDRLAATGDPDDALIARDIDRQLKGPGQPQSEITREEMDAIEEMGRDMDAAANAVEEAIRDLEDTIQEEMEEAEAPE